MKKASNNDLPGLENQSPWLDTNTPHVLSNPMYGGISEFERILFLDQGGRQSKQSHHASSLHTRGIDTKGKRMSLDSQNELETVVVYHSNDDMDDMVNNYA